MPHDHGRCRRSCIIAIPSKLCGRVADFSVCVRDVMRMIGVLEQLAEEGYLEHALHNVPHCGV